MMLMYCGASMLHLFLKNFSIDSDVYIPNRIEEGYGISEQAIDKAKEQDIKLIISVDCGITASDKVDYSNKLGIEFIICDTINLRKKFLKHLQY